MNILLLAPDLETNVTYHSDKHIVSNILGTLRVISDSIHIISKNDNLPSWLKTWRDLFNEENILVHCYNPFDATTLWITTEEDESLQEEKLILASCYMLSLVQEFIFRFDEDPKLIDNILKVQDILNVIILDKKQFSLDDLFERSYYNLLEKSKLCKLTGDINLGNIIRDYQALLRRHKVQFSQFTKRPIPNFYEKDMYDTFLQ